MHTLLLVLFGQCVFAVVVIFVLKGFLEKELMMAALEKFESCKFSPDIREVAVRTASSIGDEFKGHIEAIKQRKMPQANLNFQKDTALKGGVIIAVGDLLLDFSFRSRLQHLWS